MVVVYCMPPLTVAKVTAVGVMLPFVSLSRYRAAEVLRVPVFLAETVTLVTSLPDGFTITIASPLLVQKPVTTSPVVLGNGETETAMQPPALKFR